MKNSKLFSIATAFIFLLSSCSSNDELLIEENPTNLLKSYTLKRDASGAYYLGYVLSDNAVAQSHLDVQSNTKEIYLYASDVQSANRDMKQDLTVENNRINLNFIDTNTEQKPQITILDDNIQMAKNTSEEQLVDTYSITGNEDGTIDLAFNVKENVEVNFVYNEADGIYEIHLKEGNGTTANFDRTFTKEQGEALHVAFVNHLIDDSVARSASSVRKIKRPELIIN